MSKSANRFGLLGFCCICIALMVVPCWAADCDVYGLGLKAGDSKTVPGKCSLITCNGKGYEEHTIKACPNAYAPPNCKFVPADLSKNYPDCCPHWSC